MNRGDVARAVAITAQIFGREFSKEAADVFVHDLAAYPADAVVRAIERCRKELPRFPAVADIIARIEDGRPGVEEAWAMVPKDESASVVWTDEMREAFAAASPLLEEDPIAARMTFREVYSTLVSEARANHVPVRWTPSLGHSPGGRVAVLREAVEKGRLALDHAQSLLPELAPPPARLAIDGPRELSTIDPKQVLAEIRKRLEAPKEDA